jgi:anaerobic dimethyl sulfoxide reductase subunit C (anchor subunit)
VGTITTIAIVLGLGAAVPVGLAVLAFLAFALCLICQFFFTARLKSVGYGVDVFVNQEPFKTTYTLWFIFGLAALAVALIAAVALQSAVAAYAGVICAMVGIVYWTILFYKVALKVKMFPMYSVDLNLNM